jgi:hypothetical protein
MVDKVCVVATILFVVANILRAAEIAQFHNRDHFDYKLMKDFDGSYIQSEWSWRMDNSGLTLASGVVNALAWFVFSIPILQVVWIQSMRGTRNIGLHVTVALFAIGGAVTELLSRLIYIGSSNSMAWMAKDFNLSNWLGGGQGDDLGWKSLELVNIAVRGILLWVDAIEWLFLAGIFTLLGVSVLQGTEHLFGVRWAGFGAVMACMAVFDFAADILRFESWRTFSEVAMLISAINRLVLFPIWLLWLARLLPKAEAAALAASSTPTDATAKLTADLALNDESSLT